MKIFATVLKLYSGHDFHRKNVVGVSVLVPCTSSDDALHLYQVSGKYLKRYQNYGADTKT